MKRRNFLTSSIALGFGLTGCKHSTDTSKTKTKLFRIVHITDMHIFPAAEVEKAINALLQELHSMEKKPDFVLNTGDNIMDALKHPKEEVIAQWEVWKSYFKDKLKYPLHNCIGNHDVWGWGINNAALEKDPLFGKAWAMSLLGLKERYYSFNHKGWKFICLDSSFQDKSHHAYTAKLDEDQFQWLKNELKNTARETPVCIASHIPILSPAVFYDGDNEKDGNWDVPGAWMHIDSRKIKDLFYKYPNIKAALSGHVHLADTTEYLGVRYICNGAVCGGWWKGKYQEFGPAYAVIDFFSDDSVNSKLIQYNF